MIAAFLIFAKKCEENGGVLSLLSLTEKLGGRHGTLKGTPNFVVDTFKTVEAIDVDRDGTDELVMRQYASIGHHANYFGDVETVFKISNTMAVCFTLKIC